MGRPGWILLSLLLAACAGSPQAPVEDRRGQVKAVSRPDVYTVRRGDTLYSISWRYGLDYRNLARLNNIDSSYTIFPGQELKLVGRAPARSSKSRPAGKPSSTAKAPATPPASPAAKPVTKASSPRVTNTSPAGANASVNSWLWPSSGKVVRKFSGTVHKGIDIDGKAGDKVLATAPGKVVYAGSGIVGYGNLLIVKHNEVYLSAYGHNRSLKVAEGDRVKAGQQIAEKGSSATNSVKLHFEIRREGKPVDPLKLLPRR